MAGKLTMNWECNVNCKSPQHASLVNAAIIRGTDTEAIAFMKNLCQRCCFNIDKTGKTPLHIAASCGKIKVVKWLLANGVLVNQRDWESGYTALHRALFYGHLDVALVLIKAGGNLTTLDQDALSPLDHLMLDRPFEKSTHNPSTSEATDKLHINSKYINSNDMFSAFELEHHLLDTYVWGINTNYNLGLANQQSKEVPEFLEFFKNENKSICCVSLNKFHSMFVTKDGQVYGCGHEHGGRLGLETESSIIIPRRVKTLSHITSVSAGLNHTLFLNTNGQVLSCGMNECYQLGINPPPKNVTVPRQLSLHKSQSGLSFVGVGTGRFHSVIWTNSELYTFGLNAGQLGHFKHENETKILTPRKVTSLTLKAGMSIKEVAVSDGAVVVATCHGVVYVLHQYQTRQAAVVSNIKKIVCIGGRLDDKVHAKGLTSDGGTELKFAILDHLGHIYLWTEQYGFMRKCLFTLNREVLASDICINKQMILLSTYNGEAFQGVILPIKEEQKQLKNFRSSYSTLATNHNSSVPIKLSRLPCLHRTVSVFTDPKGLNFVSLQTDPSNAFLKSGIPKVRESSMKSDMMVLFDELQSGDSSNTDTVINSQNISFYAHAVILVQRCDYFKYKLFPHLVVKTNKFNIESDHSKSDPIIGNSPYEFTFNLPCNLIRELLRFMYCGKFNSEELKKIRPLKKKIKNNKKSSSKVVTTKNSKNSAYSVYNKMEINTNNNNTECNENEYVSLSHPVSYISSIASKFGIKYLEMGRLQICEANCYTCMRDDPTFKRLDYLDLADIEIKCEDGEKVIAHRVILYARLEYFRAMLGSCWLEGSGQETISIQLPHDMVEIVVNYLYEDRCNVVSNSNDVEYICEAMVAADHFLVDRLKEICEERLSNLVTLKNVSNIFCFAISINAMQLCKFTMTFICQNLCALLESGALHNLPRDALKKLSSFYQDLLPCMNFRIITPYQCGPSSDTLEQMLLDNPVQLPSSDDEWESDMMFSREAIKSSGSNFIGTSGNSSSRKKRRSHRNSEGRIRKASTSSQFSSASEGDLSKDLGQDFESLSFDDLQDMQEQNGDVCKKDFDDDTVNHDFEQIPKIESDSSNWSSTNSKSSTNSNFKNNSSSINLKPGTDVISPTTYIPEHLPQPNLRREIQTNGVFPSLSDSFASPLNLTSHSKKLLKPGKLSQKQRKKLAAAQENTSQVLPAPVKAWNVVENTCESVATEGFASIMKEEKASFLSTKPKPNKVFKPNTPTKLARSNSSNTNPWSSKPREYSSSSPDSEFPLFSAATSPNFSMILQEEKVQNENLLKEMVKPLSLIQLEDQAIEELLTYYGADNNPEENISVVRVRRAVANPTWSKS